MCSVKWASPERDRGSDGATVWKLTDAARCLDCGSNRNHPGGNKNIKQYQYTGRATEKAVEAVGVTEYTMTFVATVYSVFSMDMVYTVYSAAAGTLSLARSSSTP